MAALLQAAKLLQLEEEGKLNEQTLGEFGLTKDDIPINTFTTPPTPPAHIQQQEQYYRQQQQQQQQRQSLPLKQSQDHHHHHHHQQQQQQQQQQYQDGHFNYRQQNHYENYQPEYENHHLRRFPDRYEEETKHSSHSYNDRNQRNYHNDDEEVVLHSQSFNDRAQRKFHKDDSQLHYNSSYNSSYNADRRGLVVLEEPREGVLKKTKRGEKRIRSISIPTCLNDERIPDDTITKAKRRSIKNRQVHNLLEKNRRAHLKNCFEDLKDAIPALNDSKQSTVSIIQHATKYIQEMDNQCMYRQLEIERMKRLNAWCVVQLEQLEKFENLKIE